MTANVPTRRLAIGTLAAVGLLLLGIWLFSRPGREKDKEKGPEVQNDRPQSQEREFQGEIKVGHLVGICMSPLFLADAKGYFKDEGLNVTLVPMSSGLRLRGHLQMTLNYSAWTSHLPRLIFSPGLGWSDFC